MTANYNSWSLGLCSNKSLNQVEPPVPPQAPGDLSTPSFARRSTSIATALAAPRNGNHSSISVLSSAFLYVSGAVIFQLNLMKVRTIHAKLPSVRSDKTANNVQKHPRSLATRTPKTICLRTFNRTFPYVSVRSATHRIQTFLHHPHFEILTSNKRSRKYLTVVHLPSGTRSWFFER